MGGAAMNIMLALIASWLSVNFDLPAVQEHPKIEFVAPQKMATLRYGAAWTGQGPELVAIYDDKSSTVFLSHHWTGKTPAEISILVHEFVHHLQNRGRLQYQCPAAREALAYAAQEKWLGMFNKSLLSEFEIDPFTLKVSTACM
ncbi:MAG TPA: DUF6647 family protein [Xanthobacteraceae bacterium]|nr:DUF6647 family protein [Xanthobacteraceae bacterium]